MTKHDLERRKNELGYTNAIVAVLSGVSLEKVEEIFSDNLAATITYEERNAVENVLRERDADRVCEGSLPYFGKKQGEFTLDDYYAMPEDTRVELIDGVLYEMLDPTTIHQDFGFQIAYKLQNYIEKNKGKCWVAVAPVDVQLDCDNRTMVEPDVIVVCNRDKIIRRCVYGAPDFIVEVLSPSTKKKDLTIKLNKYIEAGVKEYWLVDPEKQRVQVHRYEKDDLLTMYTFEDKVPVGIWGDDCEVNFSEIYDYISFLYEKENSNF